MKFGIIIGDPQFKCALWACFYTLAASDTFSAVRVLHRVYVHLAGAGAGSAIYTCILIKRHFEKADLLEQGIESSQGAYVLAKRPVDKYRR